MNFFKCKDTSVLCHLEMLVDKPSVSSDRQLLYVGIMKSSAQQQLKEYESRPPHPRCLDTVVVVEPLVVCGTDEEIHLDNGNWTTSCGG